jgi:Family of unknown function (DUF695)
MFGKRKYKNINEYPENWMLLESGKDTENYTIIRINDGIKEAAGHPDYPIRIGVAIPVNSLTDENKALYDVEDILREQLESKGLGIQAMAVSGMGGQEFKEFVFYAKESVDFKTLHEDVQAAFPKYEIQFYAKKDSDWSVYKEYVM